MDLERFNSISKEIIYENINIADKDQNFDIYFLYYTCFIAYLIEKYNLDEFDKQICESKLHFTPVKEENMDIYQYFSSPYLKYLYLRNNIHIERLTKDEREFLKSKINSTNVLDQEMKFFIEETYKKLIFEDVLENGERYLIAFGPDSAQLYAHNDAIVLGIRYDKYDIDSSDIRKALETSYNQEKYISLIIQQIESQSSELEILSYGDFNTIKIKEKEKTK